MFEYAKASDVKAATKECEEIIHYVQKMLKDYFTFDIRLIGSGDKKLVTKNGQNGAFDLDYNLIIQRDKKDLINNPKDVKSKFKKAFDSILINQCKGYKYACDSTSVLTIKYYEKNNLRFSFDVAILIEHNDGSYSRLTDVKRNGVQTYVWNQIPHSRNYREKILNVKRKGQWNDFKQRYLRNKNNHLSKNDNVKSFSIFLETLNEF